ncbi:MAG: glycoside hydrolase family 3 C-terminal domain-containing protein [Ktedonobacteraceae bacterium]|nr:glycoside hydrolase family 3 C-terminal domain-containing protein [Ktedonobacteraceae bacterium]
MQQQYTANMSLEEQIGQLIGAGFPTTTPTPEIIDLIQNRHIGSIVLFARNIQSPQQVSELTQSLQKIAREAGHRYPLLISVDQENGMVQRMGDGVPAFPGNMALGAVGDEQLVYEVALATGRNLRSLGLNVNLAPVVDVNNNPSNPVIGVRSFGEDPQRVAQFAAAAVRGYREAGVVSTLKHFPGHGDTAVDSHLSLPVVPHDLERLESLELLPFRRGIAAGANSVMIAHLYLPQLMQQEMTPSSISPEIIRGLLRERLGFGGVITTDCLEMEAVSKTIGTERAAMLAIKAGLDIALISHTYARQTGGIDAIKAAVQDGSLSEDVVRQAAERVLSLKARMLSWEAPQPLSGETLRQHQQLGTSAYERSTTLVRNDEGLLPLHLRPEQRLLLVFPQPTSYTLAVDKFMLNAVFEETIRRRHGQVSAIAISTKAGQGAYERLDRALQEADVVITVTINVNIDPQQAEIVKRILGCGRPTIGIAAYNPYDLLSFQQLQTYLATYECTPSALEAVARVIFGEIRAQGHLPVSLPGLYEVGHGIE